MPHLIPSGGYAILVLTLTDCPPRLRGDLSKWLCELSAGVYVGHLSTRVRDALWVRICLNLKTGRATLVYTAPGEQRMCFRTHNAGWSPVDFDGIVLMRRPLPESAPETGNIRQGFSKAAQRLVAQRVQAKQCRPLADYVALDIETTGLRPKCDAIIEIGAVKVEAGHPTQTFSALIRQDTPLPTEIVSLTGLSDTQLRQGHSQEDALRNFLSFVGDAPILGHNIAFDMAFLRVACRRCNLPILTNPCHDLQRFARRRLPSLPNYKLSTLATYFDFPAQAFHRALPDAQLVHRLYTKLNE